MAGIKINQYPLERLAFGDDDYYDIDYWTGSSYETAKIKGSVIKAAILAAVVSENLFNTNNLTLSANREHFLTDKEFKFDINDSSSNIIGNSRFGSAGIVGFLNDTSTNVVTSYNINGTDIIFIADGPSNYTSLNIAPGSISLSEGGTDMSIDGLNAIVSSGNGTLQVGSVGTSNTWYTDNSTNKYGILLIGFGETSETNGTGANYSTLVDTSLVPKKYVDDEIAGLSVSSIYSADGVLSGNRILDLDGNSLSFNNQAGDTIISLLDNGAFTLGKGATTAGEYSVAIGFNAEATDADSSIAIGTGSDAKGNYDIAIGYNSSAETNSGVAIGNGAKIITGIYGVAIGNNAQSTNSGGIAMGVNTQATTRALALGFASGATSSYAIALGYASVASGVNSIAIGGRGNTVSGQRSILLSTNNSAQTNSVDQTFVVNLNDTTNALYIGQNVDSYYGGSGNFGFGTTTPSGKVTVQGDGTTTGSTFALYDNDTTPNKTWDFLDNGNIKAGQNAVVTGDASFYKFSLYRPWHFANYGALYTIDLNNSFSGQTSYAGMLGTIVSNTGGSEEGDLALQVAQNGTLTTKLKCTTTSVEISTDLDMDNNRITNAVINPPVQETTSDITFTIDADNETLGVLTAMAGATTIEAPTGTPVQGQRLMLRFKDDGTSRAFTWNAVWRAIGVTLPASTTANKTLYVGAVYNSTDTKWDVIAVKEEA